VETKRLGLALQLVIIALLAGIVFQLAQAPHPATSDDIFSQKLEIQSLQTDLQLLSSQVDTMRGYFTRDENLLRVICINTETTHGNAAVDCR